MDESWEVVRVVGTDEEADLIQGLLESYGVPCQLESIVSHEFPVNFGDLGEVRVLVPADQLERARELLDRQESEAEAEPDEEGDEEDEAGEA
jgi:Putative prokaryotic signal transducing protein